jgi:hypothetical protein
MPELLETPEHTEETLQSLGNSVHKNVVDRVTCCIGRGISNTQIRSEISLSLNCLYCCIIRNRLFYKAGKEPGTNRIISSAVLNMYSK